MNEAIKSNNRENNVSLIQKAAFSITCKKMGINTKEFISLYNEAMNNLSKSIEKHRNLTPDLQAFVDGKLTIFIQSSNEYIHFRNQLQAAGIILSNEADYNMDNTEGYDPKYPYFFMEDPDTSYLNANMLLENIKMQKQNDILCKEFRELDFISQQPSLVKPIDWDLPEIAMGYEEHVILNKADLAVYKYSSQNDYIICHKFDVLRNVARDIIHSYYVEKAKTLCPKFKVTISASEAKELLHNVEQALAEKCQELDDTLQQDDIDRE